MNFKSTNQQLADLDRKVTALQFEIAKARQTDKLEAEMAEINLQAVVDKETIETIRRQAETIELMTTSWTIFAEQKRKKIEAMTKALEAWATFGETGNHADFKYAKQKTHEALADEP